MAAGACAMQHRVGALLGRSWEALCMGGRCAGE